METPLDPRIGYLIVFVVPVAVYYLHGLPYRVLPLYALLVLSFTAGALELLGVFTVLFYMNVIDLIVIVLFAYIIIKKKADIHLPGLTLISLFIVVSFVSGVINDMHIIQVLLFLRRYIIPVLFLWYIFNIPLREKDIYVITAFILALFLSQIPVSIGKLMLVGQEERYMGTMTITGGSLTTSFALFGVIIFFAYYLYERKFVYLAAIAGFFIFAMIGEKRAVFVYAPAVILSMVYFSQQNINWLKRIRQMAFGVAVASVLFYLSVVLNPTLNPEDRIGGSFDLDYLIDYTENYLFPDRVIRGSTYYGRGEAPIATWNLLTKEENRSQLLFGFGAGDLVMSRFIEIPHEDITRGEDLIGYKYDIGYGGRTGILWTLLQVGITGTILYFVFYFMLFAKSLSAKKERKDTSFVSVLMTGLITLWILDIFTYSRIMMTSFPVVMPFMWFLYISISRPDVRLNIRMLKRKY